MELTPNYFKEGFLMKPLPTRIYLEPIKRDLQKKMVFVGGPRQVGKTTLATSLIKNYQDGHPAYLNWDHEETRQLIKKSLWSKDEPLIVLDEIHKRKGWQTFVKGIWDTWKNTQKFIITGSARLDIFRKGGDSLMGRYHYYRLHPFTLPEYGNTGKNLDTLFKFGGFPEPLLAGNETELRRWHLQRVSKLVRVDLRDIENVTDLDKVELLAETLLSRAGSGLSYRSLAEDLSVSDKTVRRWVDILDSLYYCYRIAPYGAPKIKAVKKTQKLYLWDWSMIEDKAARFENMVASHLLKLCDYWQDVEGFRSELRYIRDETGRECDFVVIKNKKPVFAVECKLSDTALAPSLEFFRSRLDIPKWYQVHLGTTKRTIAPDLSILPFSEFCKTENLI
jgi:predicted AAA+ superfamily ATPase